MSYKHVLVAALEKEETHDGPFDLSAFITNERRHGSDIYAAFLEALAKKLPTCSSARLHTAVVRFMCICPPITSRWVG